MVDSRGRMWSVGGETFSFSHHLDMVATFSPDFDNKNVQGIWAPIHAKGEKGPSPRYGHSAVIHEDKVCTRACLRGPYEVRERFSDFIPYWLR